SVSGCSQSSCRRRIFANCQPTPPTIATASAIFAPRHTVAHFTRIAGDSMLLRPPYQEQLRLRRRRGWKQPEEFFGLSDQESALVIKVECPDKRASDRCQADD